MFRSTNEETVAEIFDKTNCNRPGHIGPVPSREVHAVYRLDRIWSKPGPEYNVSNRNISVPLGKDWSDPFHGIVVSVDVVFRV